MFMAPVLLTIALLATSASPEASTRALVISHATVIDVKSGTAVPDRDIVIRGDRIVSVEPAGAHPGARVMDARGKYLIPGLWDMHVHLSWTTDCALPVLLATGITDVRDMGSRLSQIDDWRARIDAGVLDGPRILRVGPILNGKSFNQYQMVPGDSDATRGAVRALAFIGVDAIKVHRRLPRASYFAAIDEAKKLGIPLVGHIPMEVTPAEASDAGQATIEHTQTLFEGTFSAHLTDAEVPEAIRKWLSTSEPDSLFARFVRNGTWVTPTLEGYEEAASFADSAAPHDPRERYVSLSERTKYEKQMKENPMSPSGLRDLYGALSDATARMHKDGVRLLAGTDAAGPRLVGFSLHKELREMVKCGMTNAEALRTATLNPALALGKTEDLGSVEAGKFADLVVLDGNPLDHIENTERIAAVLARGRLYRRAQLDALLAKSARLAAMN